MSSKKFPVEVVNFVNPHLFWFVSLDDISRRSNLEKELQASTAPPKKLSSAVQGQLVAVLCGGTRWKRGYVENHSSPYKVWLCDYATFTETNTVYTAPETLLNRPPFAKQAALKDYVNVNLTLGSRGLEPSRTVEFAMGTIKRCKNLLDDAKSVEFQCMSEEHNVHQGKLRVDERDLIKLLVQDNVLCFDEKLYEEALKMICEEDDFFKFVRSKLTALPCGAVREDACSFIEEFVDVQGIGRGTKRRSPKNAKTDCYVTNWVNQAHSHDSDGSGYDFEEFEDAKSNVSSELASPESCSSQPEKLNAKEGCKTDSFEDVPERSSPVRSAQSLERSTDVDASFNSTKSDIAESTKRFFEKKFKSPGSTSPAPTPLIPNTPSPTLSKSRSPFSDLVSRSSTPSSLKLTPAGMQIKPRRKNSTPPPRRRSSTESQKFDDAQSYASKCSSVSRKSKESAPLSQSSLQRRVLASSVNEEMLETEDVGKIMKEHLRQNCTQGCACPHCKEWDPDSLAAPSREFADTKPKQAKVLVRPRLLLRSPDSQDVIEIKTHTSVTDDATGVQKSTMGKILVHGTSIPVPSLSLACVPFHSDIHRALRSFSQPFTIQSYVWPAIMRHLSVCMVGNPKSGKTLAYLPALCSYLLEQTERYEDLPRNVTGPIVIILCPGSSVAENVRGEMATLINKCSNKPACAFAVAPLDKTTLSQFHKQVDALVTTPTTLVNLLESRIITLKRLCHLVVESADDILKKFRPELNDILNATQSMLEHRSCSLSVQTVTVAEQWSRPLESFLKKFLIVPVICIASHLEAALYGEADIKVEIAKAKDKPHKIADMLSDTSSMMKTVIVCNDDDEIEEMVAYLEVAGVNAVMMYDKTEKTEIVDLETRWNCATPGKYSTLVCTQTVLVNHINVSNAHFLIHYSLPPTWIQFTGRFGCLLDNYTSPLATKPPSNVTKCKVHIFIDQTCTKQCAKVIQLLLRLKATLTKTMCSYYQKMLVDREETKIASKVKLCKQLLIFGRCLEDRYESASQLFPLRCPRRHFVSPDDYPADSAPKSGIIKFKILRVQDVTTFTVKLLEHTQPDGTVTSYDQHPDLEKDLQAAMKEYHVGAFNVKTGEWCVFQLLDEDKTKRYCRCVVTKILEHDKITKLPSQVAIRMLDSGLKKKVSPSFLYEVPKVLLEIPPQGVDVIISNLIPPDRDDSWSAACHTRVKKLLDENEHDAPDIYCLSKIVLRLGDTIWVENVHLRERLSSLNTIVTRLDLKSALKKHCLVNYTEQPLKRLREMCRKAGIVLPAEEESTAAKESETEQAEPQWAFLDDSDCNEVYISCVETPSLFFVKLKKFYNLLENLQKEIQDFVRKPLDRTNFKVAEGKYYLAKDFAGEDYGRVKVLKVKESAALCFYVDFGDFADVAVANMTILPNSFITKLPFQAIECRLYGIAPAWTDWEGSAADVVQEYAFEPASDYFRTVYVTTCAREPAAKAGSAKCAVILADSFTDGLVTIVNKLLLECGEAVPVDGEDLGKEFYVCEVPAQDDDEDDPLLEEVEGKEFSIDELNELQKKYKRGPDPEPPRPAPESNSAEPEWDVVVFDSEILLKQMFGLNVNERPIEDTSQQERLLNPMRALPAPGYFTPDVVWHQSAANVVVKILLSSLEDYTFKIVQNRMLMFRTVYQKKDYRLDLQLYGRVEKTYRTFAGVDLKIVLTKATAEEWPRLLFKAERLRHVRYDAAQISVPEEVRKPFLTIGKDEEEDNNADDEWEINCGSDDDDDESDPEPLQMD